MPGHLVPWENPTLLCLLGFVSVVVLSASCVSDCYCCVFGRLTGHHYEQNWRTLTWFRWHWYTDKHCQHNLWRWKGYHLKEAHASTHSLQLAPQSECIPSHAMLQGSLSNGRPVYAFDGNLDVCLVMPPGSSERDWYMCRALFLTPGDSKLYSLHRPTHGLLEKKVENKNVT